MTAGLPGTGLGGLLYLVLALYMPLHELVRTLRGRGSRERWRLALTQLAIAVAIIAAVAGSVWSVVQVVPGARGEGAAALLTPLGGLGVLLLLVVVVAGWGAWAGRRTVARH